MGGFRNLPCELILEICDQSPGTTVQALRLVCRDFNELLTPYIFRRPKFELQAPPRYAHCSKHGWYERTPLDGSPNLGRPCNGRVSVAGSLRLVRRFAKGTLTPRACAFFDSKEWRTMKREKKETNDANPIKEHAMVLLRDVATMTTISHHARALTLTLRSDDFFTMAGGRRGDDVTTLWWDSDVDIEAAMARVAYEVLRPLLEALPNAQGICLNIDYFHWSYPLALARVLRDFCSSVHPPLEIDVQANVGNQRYSLCQEK